MGNGKFSRPFPKLVTPKYSVLGLFVAPPWLFGIVSSQQCVRGGSRAGLGGAGAAPKAPLAAERGNGAVVFTPICGAGPETEYKNTESNNKTIITTTTMMIIIINKLYRVLP